MSKLTEEDIIIKTPGRQLEEAILEKFSSLDEFAETINIKRSAIYTYLHTKPYGSESFKIKLLYALGKGYNDIVRSDSEQINEYIDLIKENIKQYNKESDEGIFEKLLNLCNTSFLKSKVYRLVSKYHFFSDRKEAAIECIKIAIKIAKEEENYLMLLSFYTDLIMYHYYQRQYKSGEIICHQAEDIIDKVFTDDREIYFDFYYRAGVLHNQHDFFTARNMFVKALTYSSEENKLDLQTNIALSYKREQKYDLAIKYYEKSLKEVDEDNYKKSIICNNIASLYNSINDTNKALHYNSLSFELLPNNNIYIDNKIIYSVTRCEIDNYELKLGTINEIVDYLKKGAFDKKNIFLALNCLIESAKKLCDMSILNTTEDLIYNLTDKEEANLEYIEELEKYLGKILKARRSIRKGCA